MITNVHMHKTQEKQKKEQGRLYYLLADSVRFYPATDTIEIADSQKKLEPQVSQLLVLLLKSVNETCSKELILQTIWHDRVVTDDSVRVLIRKLRDELEDEVKAPRFIKTIPRRGYQLICSVVEKSDEKKLTDQISLRLFSPFLIFAPILLVYWFVYVYEPYPDANKNKNDNVDFAITQLTTLPGSELAPDYHASSERLVFSYRENQEDLLSLYVKDVKSGTTQKLSDDKYNYINAFWNNAGDKLFYTRFRGEDSQHFSADFSEAGLLNQQELPQELNRWYLKSTGPDDSLVFASTTTPRHIAIWDFNKQHLRHLTSPQEGEGDIYAVVSSDGMQLAVLRAVNEEQRELLIMDLHTGTLLLSMKLPLQAYRLLWTDSDSHLLISSFSGEILKLDIASKSWTPIDLQQANINHLFFDCGASCIYARQHSGNYLDIAEQANPFGSPSSHALMTISSPGVEDFPVYGDKGTVYFVQKQSDGIWLIKKSSSSAAQKLFLLPSGGELQALSINSAKSHLTGKMGKRMFYFDIDALHFQWISSESDNDFFPHFEPEGHIISYASETDGILQFHRFDIATGKLATTAQNKQFAWGLEDSELILDVDNTLWLKTLANTDQTKQALVTLPSSSPNRYKLLDDTLFYTDRKGNNAYLYRFSLSTLKLEEKELAKNRLKLNFDINDTGSKLLGVNSVLAQSNLVKVTFEYY